MVANEKLDFAYRYPFSKEAKEIVKETDIRNEDFYLKLAKARIEEALNNEKIEYRETNYNIIDNIISYVYARLLVSSLQNPLAIEKYSKAEARRSAIAMSLDSESNLMRLAEELGVNLEKLDDGFRINVVSFLKIKKPKEYSLSNQKLSNGFVEISRHEVIAILLGAAAEKIKQGLPIPKSEIPKQIRTYAKEINILYKPQIGGKSGRNEEWIDKLLSNPVPDVRQRIVNLILAPYLVNVKKLDVNEAYKIIVDYIDKCRAIDPSTKITNQQIMYQCNYSKSKGMKPLSFYKAKELLSNVVDISEDKKDGEQ